jgi:hypothetical protein
VERIMSQKLSKTIFVEGLGAASAFDLALSVLKLQSKLTTLDTTPGWTPVEEEAVSVEEAIASVPQVELVITDVDTNERGVSVYFWIRFHGERVPSAGPATLDEGLMLDAETFEALGRSLNAKVVRIK